MRLTNPNIKIKLGRLLVVLILVSILGNAIDAYRFIYTERFGPLTNLQSLPWHFIAIGTLVILLPEIFYLAMVLRKRKELNVLDETYFKGSPFSLKKYWILGPAIFRPSQFAIFLLLSLGSFLVFIYLIPQRWFILLGIASFSLTILVYAAAYMRYRILAGKM